MILLVTGVVSSPSFPGNYPNNIDRTESLKVASGKTLRIEFTHFAVYPSWNCSSDYVKVTDGDGTILLDRSCGYSNVTSTNSYYFSPPIITTKSNTVDIFFHTNSGGTQVGWTLNWMAVTQGI